MARIIANQKLSAGELASKLAGKLHGDPARQADCILPLSEARAGALTFCDRSSNRRLATALADTSAAIVLIPTIADLKIQTSATLIEVDHPLSAVIELLPLFFEQDLYPPGVSATAAVDPTVQLGDDIYIGDYAVIGPEVVIEDRSVIHPHVTIYPRVRLGQGCVVHAGAVLREDVTLGDHCVIQNGAVIGADGFGYIPDQAGNLHAVPQVGAAKLGNEVHIGANSCVDRGTLGNTTVGDWTKIDNLVQTGHNVSLGQNCIVCGQTGIAGSVSIGNRVVLGGGCGVQDHVSIADGCRFAGHSGVIGDITERGDYAGMPALPARQWRRLVAQLRRMVKNR